MHATTTASAILALELLLLHICWRQQPLHSWITLLLPLFQWHLIALYPLDAVLS
jgi:hypothetical protein